MPGHFCLVTPLHPALRIISLLLLALLAQMLQAAALGLLAALLAGFCWLKYAGLFRGVLRRSRWLLLTLLLIFAFTTPGEYLPGWPIAMAPTYEGLREGGLQMLRLIIMLAGLALLLGSTPREAMMAGIHCLLRPLRLVGLPPERFTARLWLTLHYVEQAPVKHEHRWSMLDRLEHADPADSEQSIRLQMPPLTWRDALAVACVIAWVGWWMS